jgi:DNA-binding phage protein
MLNKKEQKALELLRTASTIKGLEVIAKETGISEETLFQCLERDRKGSQHNIFPSLKVAKLIINTCK